MSERASGGESLEGAGSREICLLCVTSPWDDPVIIMNVLVVPRISSSSPLSPSASPFNLVEGILDASFHRFSFFSLPQDATIIRGSVSLPKSKSIPPYRRFGQRQIGITVSENVPDSLFPFPLKAEGGEEKNAARRVSKSLASRSSFFSSRVPGKLSLSSFPSLFFSSLLETHRKLSSPPFPSRASRFIRFSSAKISILFGRGIDTFSSSSPDIPEQPAPLPYVSLSHTRETFVARERKREREENGRCLYIDRSGRIECSLEGNSRSLPQEIRGTRDLRTPLLSILSSSVSFFLLPFPSFSLSFQKFIYYNVVDASLNQAWRKTKERKGVKFDRGVLLYFWKRLFQSMNILKANKAEHGSSRNLSLSLSLSLSFSLSLSLRTKGRNARPVY